MTPKLPLSFLLFLVGCGVPEASEQPDAVPTSAPGRIFYSVTKVEGWYGGSATKVMAPTWMDTLNRVTCTFDSAGTKSTQKPFVGDPVHDTFSAGISVSGLAKCPGAMAVSTSSDGCTSKPLTFADALFQWSIALSGWENDSVVTLKAHSPPSNQPSCNFASVLNGPGHTWDLEATTTLGKFREGNPFPVRFVGERTLKHDGNTSNVSWDLTITIDPAR